MHTLVIHTYNTVVLWLIYSMHKLLFYVQSFDILNSVPLNMQSVKTMQIIKKWKTQSSWKQFCILYYQSISNFNNTNTLLKKKKKRREWRNLKRPSIKYATLKGNRGNHFRHGLAATFIMQCIWSVILSYTNFISLTYCIARMQEKSCI